MINQKMRLESIHPAIREDLRSVIELIGHASEPSDDSDIWEQSQQKLRRVCLVTQTLNEPALQTLSQACYEVCLLVANRQFQDNSEMCQRLLASLQMMADHFAAFQNADMADQWLPDLLDSLGANSQAKAANTNSKDHQSLATEHVNQFQQALLSWLTGRDSEGALAQLVSLCNQCAQAMPQSPFVELNHVLNHWRQQQVSEWDGTIRQCLSRAERLLQLLAKGEAAEARAQELKDKLAPLAAQIGTQASQTRIDINAANGSSYWRPQITKPVDSDAWGNFAIALNDDLRFVMESLDTATKVTPAEAPAGHLIAERLRHPAQALLASGVNQWGKALSDLAERIAATPPRSEYLDIAEQIEQVAACISPETFDRCNNLSEVSAKQAIAEQARSAVIDSALNSIVKLSARFEILASSEFRPSSMRPTEEIETLWSAAHLLQWNSLADATAWLRDCAKSYIACEQPAQQEKLLSKLLTGSVIVERFLNALRLPWSDTQAAEKSLLKDLHQLAPAQFEPQAS